MGVNVVRALSTPPRRPLAITIPTPRGTAWPSVGVVIATTGNRPNLLRRALASVSGQDYPGPMRIIVVYDGARPDWELTRNGERPVLVLESWRSSGLAGARNTGILAAGDCELVALCGDDDTWSVAKLATQVSAMRARPGTLFATCADEIEFNGRRTARLTGLRAVGVDQMTRDRVRALRASGYVAYQQALATAPAAGGIGLLAEDGPTGAVDWDLLMRAAQCAPILHVDRPLVRVLWRPVDIDPTGCEAKVSALCWMVARHPEIGRKRAAQLYAEIACWEAAAENRSEAWIWCRAALRSRWHTPRAILAIAASAGLIRGAVLGALLSADRGLT